MGKNYATKQMLEITWWDGGGGVGEAGFYLNIKKSNSSFIGKITGNSL